MNRLQRAAVLLELTDQLRAVGSWCGETHLQKATYFLQAFGVPTGFGFVLYKHGPFSFELRDELTAMRADGFLELHPQPPYGPSLVTTEIGSELKEEYPRTLEKYEKAIRFVAEGLGNKNVSALEQLATALFVTLEGGPRSLEQRAEEISDLKPHIDVESAEAAVNEVEEMMEAAKQL
jgi:uncharacterized protein YwgA